LDNPSSLISKVVNGGLWSISLRVAGRAMGLVRTFVLARLLAPEDFGLLGMVMGTIALLDSVSQLGFSHALIQRKGNDPDCLDAVWTAAVARGIALFLVVFAVAPIAEVFFRVDGLTSVLRVVAVSILLGGLSNVGVLLYQKELNFGKQFWLESAASLTELGVTLAAAYCLRNVWALVIGGLVLNLCRLILSYRMHPYRPSLRTDMQRWRELFGYGKWIFCSGLVLTAIAHGDSIFVGRVLGATALGYYQMALQISNVVGIEITNAVAHVVFPSYALMHEDRRRTREAFFRVLQLSMLVCVPLSAIVAILSAEIAHVFLGDGWDPAIPLIQIMGVLACLRAFAGTATVLFWGVGVPAIATRCSTWQLAALAVMLVPASHLFGLEGVAAAVVASYLIVDLLYAVRLAATIGAGAREFLRSMAAPACAAIGMMVMIDKIRNVFEAGVLGLSLLALAGAGGYAVLLLTIDAVFMASKARRLIADLLGTLWIPVRASLVRAVE
jgi:O-antigen/teichoic acid export membrane protein